MTFAVHLTPLWVCSALRDLQNKKYPLSGLFGLPALGITGFESILVENMTATEAMESNGIQSISVQLKQGERMMTRLC